MAILTNSKYSTLESQTSHSYSMPEPDYYIYFYHVGKYLTLPTYPDNISDTMTSSYSSTTPLGRSAPIQSYSGSGPRQLSFTFNLHRDMMWQLNYANSSIDLAGYNGDDYVDLMTKWI